MHTELSPCQTRHDASYLDPVLEASDESVTAQSNLRVVSGFL